MPRTTKQRTPSYCLHKPTGQARVTLNGVDHYLGRHNTSVSRHRYDQLIAEWLAGGRVLPHAEDHPVFTVKELILQYWRFAKEYYQKNGRPTPEVGKIRSTMRLLRMLYGEVPVADFGPMALKAVRQHALESGYGRRGSDGETIRRSYSRKHLNEIANQIRRTFRWGVEHELVPSSVLHALQAVSPLKAGRTQARECEPIRPVPEAHIDAVLSHVARPVRAMIELQLLTGMRVSEVRMMRACDLETTGSNVWVLTPAVHKTQHHGIEHKVYLGPQALAILKQFLKPDAQAYLFDPREALGERSVELRAKRKSKVQPSQRNRRTPCPSRPPKDHYTRSGYRWAIRRACERVDIPVWAPSRLRHNAATRFRKEYGLEVAQIMLGHQSAEVTQIYAERDTERALAVVERIG